MTGNHGCVWSRKARPHPSYRRYVAVLDVLGMKAWLSHETARNIAEVLDEALAACEPASSGTTSDGTSYGPVVGVTQFSDSLLLWSPDDSWASFVTMCGAVKMVVAFALDKGVPLRGAVASGEVVCQPTSSRFVGRAIAEAFLWSEKERQSYRSVGVDLTPSTIEKVRAKTAADPLPDCWRSDRLGIDEAVITGERMSSRLLVWYAESLFVNHWAHGAFVGGNPREMFLKRNLPVAPEDEKGIQVKIDQMLSFYEASRRLRGTEDRNASSPDPGARRQGQQREFLRLDRLKTGRDCPTRRCS
jgi:hypothetical protein